MTRTTQLKKNEKNRDTQVMKNAFEVKKIAVDHGHQTRYASHPASKTDKPILDVQHVSKSFKIGTQDVQILKDVSFTIKEGDFVIIFGPSGCGKSTMLHGILGLEPPSSGTINFFSIDIYDGTSEDDRAIIRKQHIGMIYQQANWIRSLSVVENVAFPLILLGTDRNDAVIKAMRYLDEVSMTSWANYSPSELSSGQQQRVALARALVNNPSVIVADEPTGNLDFESGQIVMKLLSDLSKTQGKTIIMVTHDLEYLPYAQTAVRMLDGKVEGIYTPKDHDRLFKALHFKRGRGAINI